MPIESYLARAGVVLAILVDGRLEKAMYCDVLVSDKGDSGEGHGECVIHIMRLSP